MSNHVLVSGGLVVQSDRSGKPPEGFISAQENVVPGYRYSGGVFSLPVDSLATLRTKALARLAARRWQAETSGVVVDGVSISTDRESTAMLTAAFVVASNDPGYSIRWKVQNGVFATVTAPQIIALAAAVREHVQACFDREDELTVEILAANAVTLGALDIETGWPA
ncbi:DUF4376 domain-containing protein [Mesorhizobium sp. M6A.T.Cr.TU.017.01.1.1]|uniref:DUF4376 domain-containing protein n=1 Tax=Mesorhizobium sp. M6A.T.Cr.TU.017.01.1.1 TaxID=2496774 RepID=UPI000FD3DF63|nr:DUF4376 domain-containing protein [Mesorhizobium sp. M6A.T.Cr.TU.017.01.1.1]RUV00065.1 DUF4376 domain-containing protein [Mesorhizobium sp. M6A.T.Cr.TU.017.01.1.1]